MLHILKHPPVLLGAVLLMCVVAGGRQVAAQDSGASVGRGGQLTVITGADRTAVQIRSTRFR
ncbi:MAG: hypothetical protein M3430_11795 [Acidobacteriota bacterium]|nr:hypothetical protein [Acidobacteriota bacterium]